MVPANAKSQQVWPGLPNVSVLRMMPDGIALVLTSSNERAGVSSANHMFGERRCQRGATAPGHERAALGATPVVAVQTGTQAALAESSPSVVTNLHLHSV